MKTIHKYIIEVTDKQLITMPVNADVLCVQVQNGNPCIWAIVDTDYEVVNYEVYTYGTGHEWSDLGCDYIGTYQLDGGSLVFHVFAGAA